MRVALEVRGAVQGVGFRPHVHREAVRSGLVGWVRNRRDRVEVEVQGSGEAIERFVARVRGAPPPARVDEVAVRSVPDVPDTAFAILPSDDAGAADPLVAPDLVACAECVEETLAADGRRAGYAFTTCARCGPRYSITLAVPWDRARTSMAAFPLCHDCAGEHGDPEDRRFHAEAIACPRCGPRLELLDARGDRVEGEPLEGCLRRLRAGEIVAVQGLGGFQLLCDATSEPAVSRLRERKRRPRRPFAVLFATLAEVERHAVTSEDERAALAGPAGPIVVVERAAGSALAPSVAPGNPDVGALLPTTPLHHLLAQAFDAPLICTSGNLSDEPLCIDAAEAVARLGGIADGFLVHDRPIVRPLDDSVARASAGRVRLIRRARGHAPREVAAIDDERTILAVGAHQKCAVAVAHRGRVVLGPHVGDLGSALARDRLAEAVADLLGYLDARPDLVACDLHPDYGSTRFAEAWCEERGVPLARAQHHAAHVAAVLAEHGATGDALGLAWDGTGLGDDGVAWGGEALSGRAGTFARVAHLAPFRLLGADAASRDPRRSALGVLAAAGAGDAALSRCGFSGEELSRAAAAVRAGVSAPWTTAIGRLFDAVAVLLGWSGRATFEGEAAAWVEHEARRARGDEGEELPLPLDARPSVVPRWDFVPLVRVLAARPPSAAARPGAALAFHRALAAGAAEVARRSPASRVALSGGCFQNRVLAERVVDALLAAGREPLVPCSLPPNDGAIAVGQIFVAAAGG